MLCDNVTVNYALWTHSLLVFSIFHSRFKFFLPLCFFCFFFSSTCKEKTDQQTCRDHLDHNTCSKKSSQGKPERKFPHFLLQGMHLGHDVAFTGISTVFQRGHWSKLSDLLIPHNYGKWDSFNSNFSWCRRFKPTYSLLISNVSDKWFLT